MKLLLAFLSLAAVAQAAPPANADEITYEFLIQTGEETGYCDHVPHIKQIFENYRVKTLLESGLGYSTKYFLDSCNKVLSVEFITPVLYPNWLKYCLDLYRDYSNWVPIAYFSNYPGDFAWAPYKFFGTTKLYEAESHFSSTLQLPTDDAYFTELRTFIGNLTKYNKIDLALVDPPTLLRGPIVQLLFDKAPIILAHDCHSFVSSQIADVYGYRRIATPDHYETIFIPKGKGTLLWIKKSDETASLIEKMKNYAQSP